MAARNDNDGSSENLPVLVHTSPLLHQNEDAVKENQALVILNSPIHCPPSPLFQQLWEASSVRVCADGGANRLYKASQDLIPNLIRGDLDSLDPSVRAYYESKGVSIERDPDQDSNDLDKALTALVTSLNNNSNNHNGKGVGGGGYTRVIIFGAFGGRFDQEMAAIQALYKWSPRFQYRLVLFDDVTSAFLLPANVKNEIRLPHFGDKKEVETGSNKKIIGEGPTCGLIPIGCKCDSVVTTGFKWDLDGSIPLEFGGLVSTSNHVSEPVVTVQSSHPLIFTAEVYAGLEGLF